MVQITVRDVDKKTYAAFKSAAVRRGLTTGQAVTLAMRRFAEPERRTSLTSLVPQDWGEGTEHASDEIDATLADER